MHALTIAHTESSCGWGGQEIRIYTEMEAMRARGHHLLLAAPERSEIFRRCWKANFEVVPLRNNKIAYPVSIVRLALWLKKHHVDVLNMHSSRDGWIGGLAGRLAKIPLILRSRHIEVDYPHKFTSRIVFGRLPHHVLTTSEKISQGLMRDLGLPASHLTCLPTGIDLERFRPGLCSTLRTELKIPENTKLLGMVSVLRGWKGHIHLFKALRLIKKTLPDWKLIVAGDGPQRENLPKWAEEEGIREQVYFLGHRTDVPEILSALDLLVVPSEGHEGIPQIVLQGQAAGVPVIGSRVGGIPEVIQHEVTGLLVPTRDPAALGEAIQRIFNDGELRTKIVTAARAQVESQNCISAMCERLESLYEAQMKKSLTNSCAQKSA